MAYDLLEVQMILIIVILMLSLFLIIIDYFLEISFLC